MLTPLPGLVPDSAALIDERGRPDLQDVYRHLLAESTEVASALTRVRLTEVTLTAAEVDAVRSLRVLVAEMNAIQLEAEARTIASDPRRSERADLLSAMLERGQLEVRSAPLAGWTPDFSVYRNESGPHSVLLGSHWFGRPYAHRGPAFAAVFSGDAARLAARRFDEAWEDAHDVGPAIWNILSRARRTGKHQTRIAG